MTVRGSRTLKGELLDKGVLTIFGLPFVEKPSASSFEVSDEKGPRTTQKETIKHLTRIRYKTIKEKFIPAPEKPGEVIITGKEKNMRKKPSESVGTMEMVAELLYKGKPVSFDDIYHHVYKGEERTKKNVTKLHNILQCFKDLTKGKVKAINRMWGTYYDDGSFDRVLPNLLIARMEAGKKDYYKIRNSRKKSIRNNPAPEKSKEQIQKKVVSAREGRRIEGQTITIDPKKPFELNIKMGKVHLTIQDSKISIIME